MVATASPQSTSRKSCYAVVDIDRLRVGAALRMPIYDDRDVLLLADGNTITKTFLRRLMQRNIIQVKVHESELSRVFSHRPLGMAEDVPEDRRGHVSDEVNDRSGELDKAIQRGRLLGLPPQGEPFAREMESHGTQVYNPETLTAFVANHHQSVEQVNHVFDKLSRGRGAEIDLLDGIADDALAQISQDADLFACLGINPFSDKYPARHSTHAAMLAMLIGTHLRLDRNTLKELAIGCLIHDAGMLKIDDRIYRSTGRVNPIDFLELTKHPVLVFDMMRDMKVIPNRSAFIAYQMHERCNGEGYPRRRKSGQIHFLSKIAAVADTYVGLVSPRPHRPGMQPYLAMERIVRGVRDGLYDSTVVRALLKAVSLFPVGSCVELSDARVGRVIRANSNNYSNPIVEVWPCNNLHAKPQIVNLAENDGCVITRTLTQLQSRADADAIADDWE